MHIGGRHDADGALKKTMHASVALKEHARLVLCIVTGALRQRRTGGRHSLVRGGLRQVLSADVSRHHSFTVPMQVGMGKYDTEFKGSDVVPVEPACRRHRLRDILHQHLQLLRSRKPAARTRLPEDARDLWQRRRTLGPGSGAPRHPPEAQADQRSDPDAGAPGTPRRRPRGSAAARARGRGLDTWDDPGALGAGWRHSKSAPRAAPEVRAKKTAAKAAQG